MKSWGFKVLILILGVAVVFLSIVRASYDVMAKDLLEENIGGEDSIMIVKLKSGETVPVEYKLADPGMLPTSPFYGFKKIRDWLWLNISGGNKLKVSILLANKKIAEAEKLWKNGDWREAIECGNEVVDKLKYAEELTNNPNISPDVAKSEKKEIFMAAMTSSKILEMGKDVFEIDQVKYKELVDKTNQFNEAQKEKSWEWME